jgi:hypothetical protein
MASQFRKKKYIYIYIYIYILKYGANQEINDLFSSFRIIRFDFCFGIISNLLSTFTQFLLFFLFCFVLCFF